MKQKLCLITGGSKGIGKEIVKNLSKKGYLVAFTYNKNKNSSLQLEKKYHNVKGFKINMKDKKKLKKLINNIESFYSKKIDVLINNAAIAQEKEFQKISISDVEEMFAINFVAPFFLSQQVITNMKKKKWGRIVNISSIGGQWGGVNQPHYAASKAALINFTKSLSKLHSKDGILSNCISIGLVKTDMSKDEISRKDGKSKIQNIPLGRVGSPSEISKIIEFLITDDSSYITGQIINANGGMI